MEFTKQWIIDNGCRIVKSYGGNITLRGLHYRLVALGMTNDVNHYKRVIAAMTDARWANAIEFNDLMDRERETVGTTKAEQTNPYTSADDAFYQIKAWAKSYRKNRWENQDCYVEVFIEKKALQGVFERPCQRYDVALNPCKGYPSLTFLYDAAMRFAYYMGSRRLVMLYFGDHDPSGDDIPRSIIHNLGRMGVEVELDRIALNKDQVIEWSLPPAPTKHTDTRSHNWDGLGQVELDSVEPNKIQELCEQAILKYFNPDFYDDLKERERSETVIFREIIKNKFMEEKI